MKQRLIQNYEEAEQHAMQVLQQEPNNADAMSLLSTVYMETVTDGTKPTILVRKL